MIVFFCFWYPVVLLQLPSFIHPLKTQSILGFSEPPPDAPPPDAPDGPGARDGPGAPDEPDEPDAADGAFVHFWFLILSVPVHGPVNFFAEAFCVPLIHTPQSDHAVTLHGLPGPEIKYHIKKPKAPKTRHTRPSY